MEQHAEGGDQNGERYDECGGRESFRKQQNPAEELFWDFPVNILGEKDDRLINFCDKCELPIKIYGQMIPCKHAFCYSCATLHGKEGDKMCLFTPVH